MSIVFLTRVEQWPAIDPYHLKMFLDRMFQVNPEVRWSGTLITTEGRLYFHLDEAERPGDMFRRCRAYFDLADPGDWHVSDVPATQAGDDLLLAAEPWFQRYKRDTESVVGIPGQYGG